MNLSNDQEFKSVEIVNDDDEVVGTDSVIMNRHDEETRLHPSQIDETIYEDMCVGDYVVRRKIY